MPSTLTDVIVWIPRANPANRIIPPHLKLAILSRGRILIPAERAQFFLDVARENGATWPGRLTKNLKDIEQSYPATFELFLNRRTTMSQEEISQSLAGYLALRRERHLKDRCWQLLFVWGIAGNRKTLESRLDVEITELFRKPHVRVRPRDDPFLYIINCYVCLPAVVRRFIAPEPKVMPPPPSLINPMPLLEGQTRVNAEAHLRNAPSKSATSKGVLAGKVARVTVSDKTEAEGELWYKIKLLDPLRVVPKVGDPLTKATDLPVGTEGWIASFGLDVLVAPWALLRHDLIEFDSVNQNMKLNDRITALRQQLHASNLPFDHVIGTKKGTTYLDKISFSPGRWQLGRDYQAFLAPDGRWVDLQHLMVGLDVLSKPERAADYLGIPIGTNYAASTWSGDVGSAAAEATLRRDITTWERWNPAAPEWDRLSHYFSSRAPDHDLLGDLDGWGIQGIRIEDPSIDKIDSLFALYYQDTISGSVRTLITQRRLAVERFLYHYGFSYDPDADYSNYPVFIKQKRPSDRVVREIYAFGKIWMLRQDKNLVWSRDENRKQPKHVGEMAAQFLYWLEHQAIEHGAVVPSKGP